MRLGEYDLQSSRDCVDGLCSDPPQEIAVHKAIPNPGFHDGNANRQDDIGLIRLAQRVSYSCEYQRLIFRMNKQTFVESCNDAKHCHNHHNFVYTKEFCIDIARVFCKFSPHGLPTTGILYFSGISRFI